MHIDENTKVIGRFHTQPSPRGLNIYNPLFEELGLNAIYLLFHNPDPRVLMEGFRNFNLTGAITAGFESDKILPTLLDDLDEASQFVGKVGFITRDGNKVVGHSQGGLGMLRTIKQVMDLHGKTLTIVGAGNIAKGLLFEINKEKIDCEIELFNRTLENATNLKDKFTFVKNVQNLDMLKDAKSDLFVNLTDIGGEVTDSFFPEEMVDRFTGVVDVTFQIEKTGLIRKALKLNKIVATGWDMFTYQGQVILEKMLGQEVDFNLFKKHVALGLSCAVK